MATDERRLNSLNDSLSA